MNRNPPRKANLRPRVDTSTLLVLCFGIFQYFLLMETKATFLQNDIFYFPSFKSEEVPPHKNTLFLYGVLESLALSSEKTEGKLEVKIKSRLKGKIG